MIDGMTIEYIWSVIKRASTSPLSSPQPAIQFFAPPSVPQQTSVDSVSTPKINCIIGKVLSSDQASYYGMFQFLDNQDTAGLDFGTHPILFTLFPSHKIVKEDSRIYIF